jgi:hypothetical protein
VLFPRSEVEASLKTLKRLRYEFRQYTRPTKKYLMLLAYIQKTMKEVNTETNIMQKTLSLRQYSYERKTKFPR